MKRDSLKNLVSLRKHSYDKKKNLSTCISTSNSIKKEFILYPSSKNNSFNKTIIASKSDINRYKDKVLFKYNYMDFPTDVSKLNIDNTLIKTRKGLISF